MASEEERAKILAEYMQAADRDVEDEEEFQVDDYDNEDDGQDSFGDESDSDGGDSHKKKDDHYAVLKGNLVLSDDGRLVYSGTWCMKKDLEAHDKKNDEEKKKTKFKMKSKQALSPKGTLFDLLDPLLPDKRPRTILFDGFFTTDETDQVKPHRKIKERDVEFIFSQGVPMKKSEGEESKQSCYVVKCKGTNDFGAFGMEGIYCPSSKQQDVQPLTCSKRYGCESTSASKRGRDYDSEDDYEISGDEAADITELTGLADDAALSVEELRKKYYGGEGDNQPCAVHDQDIQSAAKRSKVLEEEEDDDDDGCGF